MENPGIFGKYGKRWESKHYLALLKIASEHLNRNWPKQDDIIVSTIQPLVETGKCYYPKKLKIVLGWELDKEQCEDLASKIKNSIKAERTQRSINERLLWLFGLKLADVSQNDTIKVFAVPSYHNGVKTEMNNNGISITNTSSPLLSKDNPNKISGRVGLDWLDDNKNAIYVFSPFEQVDYAKMYLDVVEYCKHIDISSLLEKAQVLTPLFNADTDKRFIPLNAKKIIRNESDESSISILSSLMIANLSLMLEDVIKRKLLSKKDFLKLKNALEKLDARLKELLELSIIKENKVYKQLQEQCNSFNSITIYEEVTNKEDFQYYNEDDLRYKIEAVQTRIEKYLKAFAKITEKECSFPPFYVLMWALFELYVYINVDSLIENPYNMKYQDVLYDKRPDFVIYNEYNERIAIIDAKYKMYHKTRTVSDKHDINQIRSLSYSKIPIYLVCPAMENTLDNNKKTPSKLNVFLSNALPVEKRHKNWDPNCEVYILPINLPAF